jgi:hypothetical protein
MELVAANTTDERLSVDVSEVDRSGKCSPAPDWFFSTLKVEVCVV